MPRGTGQKQMQTLTRGPGPARCRPGFPQTKVSAEELTKTKSQNESRPEKSLWQNPQEDCSRLLPPGTSDDSDHQAAVIQITEEFWGLPKRTE